MPVKTTGDKPMNLYKKIVKLLRKGKIIEPNLCEQYKQKILSLPDIIHHKDLDSVISGIFTCPYTQALQEVDKIATKKDQILDTKKRDRVKSLISKAKTITENPDLKDLFFQYPRDSYQIRIIKPGYHARSLGKDLAIIRNCWIGTIEDLKNEYIMNRIEWLQKDIDLGACIFLIGEELDESKQEYIPKVQTRAYIAITKKDETILVYDTVENGNISCSSIYGWTQEKRGRELLYSLAAVMHIAKEYGINRICMGERETEELAGLLGFKEEVLFNERDYYKSRHKVTDKIGLPGDATGEKGPYCYGLIGSIQRRMMDLKDIKILPQEKIKEKLEEVIDFLSSFKKTRKNKNKMEEIGIYLDCLSAINELNNRHSQEVADKISELKEKYFK